MVGYRRAYLYRILGDINQLNSTPALISIILETTHVINCIKILNVLAILQQKKHGNFSTLEYLCSGKPDTETYAFKIFKKNIFTED